MSIKPIHIIGGGMAGSEAAWQAANAGVPVILHEMRGVKGTEAHQTDKLAELVCSNSFRSDDWENNAVGLLHEEMRRAGSLGGRASRMADRSRGAVGLMSSGSGTDNSRDGRAEVGVGAYQGSRWAPSSMRGGPEGC